MPSLSLSGLWIYPVKSLRGIALSESAVEKRGLRFDRRWMVVDENGHFLTQRQYPQMATIRTAIGDALHLIAPSGDTVQLPLNADGANRLVRVWRDEVPAVDCGEEAAAFLSEALGVSCRLVGITAASERTVDTRYAPEGETTYFADGFPFLIAGQASLDELNDRMLEKGEEEIVIERFRPNFLFQGGKPYEEDHWKKFYIGEVEFEIVKPCLRCVITTLDPQSGEMLGNEPLRTLSAYRRRLGGVCFAQNAIAHSTGTIRIGDAVKRTPIS